MNRIKSYIKNIKDVIGVECFALLIIFILLNLIARGTGGTNEMSRFATMKAMSHDFSFQIDPYLSWTIDWSQINGHYYSNKAPGPMFLGLPFYALLDFLMVSPVNEMHPPGPSFRVLFSFMTQIIPLIILCVYFGRKLLKESYIDRFELFIFYNLIFFGGTYSLFYNSYFGHGMSSIFILLLLMSLLSGSFVLVGLSFGFALLSEYSAALFLIPLIFMIPISKLHRFAIGGVVPGALWCLYHYFTTGNIFETLTKYMNPRFLETSPNYLWGMLRPPNLEIIGELMWGLKRGILWTQPWVLFIFISVFFNFTHFSRNEKKVTLVAIIGFFLLMILNSSFNGWHGGSISGPRYLSMGLMAMIPVALICLIRVKSSLWRRSLLFLIGLTLIVRAIIYGTTILAVQKYSLFEGLYVFVIENEAWARALFRVSLFMLSVFGIYCFKLMQDKDEKL